jgi:hypothetical protein
MQPPASCCVSTQQRRKSRKAADCMQREQRGAGPAIRCATRSPLTFWRVVPQHATHLFADCHIARRAALFHRSAANVQGQIAAFLNI